MKKIILLINKLSLINYLLGLWLTLKRACASNFLFKYREISESKHTTARGLLGLRRYSNGKERCVGCKLCAAACPAVAINIETDSTVEGLNYATNYEIDLFKCIYCGLCEQACPVDAIVQTNIEDYHFRIRGSQILTKEKLLAIGEHYEKSIKHD